MPNYNQNEKELLIQELSHISNFTSILRSLKMRWTLVRSINLSELESDHQEIEELNESLSNIGYWLALFPKDDLESAIEKIENRIDNS